MDIAHGSERVHQVDPGDPNGFIVVCRGRVLFFPRYNHYPFFAINPFRKLNSEFKDVFSKSKVSFMESESVTVDFSIRPRKLIST